jgi:hypothetical protein
MPLNISKMGYYNDLAKFMLPIGSRKSIAVDISSTDFPLTTPCRYLTAATGTVIYVDITSEEGLDANVPITVGVPCINITKIYKAGTDCTGIRAWPVD